MMFNRSSISVPPYQGVVQRPGSCRVGLSQPPLSAQLRQLRGAFVDPLLIPAARGMTPTERLAVLAPPCEVAGLSVLMGWHARAHADPAQIWLRDALATAMTDD